MANLFEYEREAIRIKARRTDVDGEEVRKFSVDPNITSFEVLQSILCRAFELPSGDISINYLHLDRNGLEAWTPLLSDWDLDTAILGSADFGLQLQVKLLEPGSLGEISNIDKGIVSPVLEYGRSLASELQPAVQRGIQEAAANAKAAGANQVTGLQGLVSKSGVQASGFFKRHYEQTLPGLASKMRTALNIDIDERVEDPGASPVSDTDFRRFLNKVGQMVSPREFRLAVYRGGLEPGLRKIGWKHLLNVYPAGMTGGERIRHLRELSSTYASLKADWMDLVLQGRTTDDVKTVINMVRKDVLRTDRQHPYFAGEGNHNVTSLFNILTTYALNHPSVSYCQGMSDLASPLLVTMVEESHAYICFTALMDRMKPNFMLDGVAMTTKFQHLSEGLMYYDPEFFTYLKLHMADDLLFCYRWLLLEMKREFPFEKALKALEVTWSSLPPATADTRLELWESRFSPKMSPSTGDLSKPCQTPYGKVAALRKRSVDRQLSDSSERKLSQVSKGRDRVMSDNSNSASEKHTKPMGNKSNSSGNVMTKRRGMTSSIDEEKDNPGHEEAPDTAKKVTNLKDFFSLTSPDSSTSGSIPQRNTESPSKAASFGEANTAATGAVRTAAAGAAKTAATGEIKAASPGSTKSAGNGRPTRQQVKTVPTTATKKAATEITASADKRTADQEAASSQQQPVSVSGGGAAVTEDANVKRSAASPAGGSVVSPCQEAKSTTRDPDDPFDFVGYSQANSTITVFCNRLPPPTQFGHGNPFLMFLCLSSILQHRDHIMKNQLDYQDIAMFFDKMVRGHDVDRVLRAARRMFAEYLNEDWSPSPQTTTGISQVPNC